MSNHLADLLEGHQSLGRSDFFGDGVPLLVGVDGRVWFDGQNDEPTEGCVDLTLFGFMADVARCSREHAVEGGKIIIDELGVVVCGYCKEVLGFVAENSFTDGASEPCSQTLR